MLSHTYVYKTVHVEIPISCSHSKIQAVRPTTQQTLSRPNKHVSLFFHPPVLKDSFRREPSDVGVVSGSSARLECSPPRGSPTPTVFWKRNGKIVDPEAEDK